jgi:hypothetical protein
MQEYVKEVIMPYAEERIQEHRLHADAKIILVLDVWAVHKSAEFRQFLRTSYPRILLVFVPPNCTSKLQVADVVLQRPFKHGITSRFSLWAAKQIKEQISSNRVVGLNDSFKMKSVKPLVLQWCIESWTELKENKALILKGWEKCCTSLYNINDPAKRNEAVLAVAKKELEESFIPSEEEAPNQYKDASDSEGEEGEDEFDISKAINFGERRSGRVKNQIKRLGFMMVSTAIQQSSDSESEEE